MKTYWWDKSRYTVVELESEKETVRIIPDEGRTKEDITFACRCGELLTNALNTEVMWEEKKRLFAYAQSNKKDTML